MSLEVFYHVKSEREPFPGLSCDLDFHEIPWDLMTNLSDVGALSCWSPGIRGSCEAVLIACLGQDLQWKLSWVHK